MSNNSDPEELEQVTSPNSKKSGVMFSSHIRQEKMKEIDALYKSQIKQIYVESKEKVDGPAQFGSIPTIKKQNPSTENLGSGAERTLPHGSKNAPGTLPISHYGSGIYNYGQSPADIYELASVSSSKRSPTSTKVLEEVGDRARASMMLQSESARTIEVLRKENEGRQLKIRDLSNRCENLVQKMRKFLTPQEVEAELSSIKQFSDRKMERIESLFKIKTEEIFFKVKLQVISLLQEFDLSKEEIVGINEVTTEAALFSFMARKLKLRLKDIRSKEQQTSFEIQKDKIVKQKNDERIHYLTETNQLLKLSESKLKQKVEDLKSQMTEYLEKLKDRERELEERQSESFRYKREIEDLVASGSKISTKLRAMESERGQDQSLFEAKEKEMKNLLSMYFLEKKKLENELMQKESQIEEIRILEKFLQQENQRLNREYVRWKERYEWLEREKENRVRDGEEEKNHIIQQFNDYKQHHNQGIVLGVKHQTDEANRRAQEYQLAYQSALMELEREKANTKLREQEHKKTMQKLEVQLSEKLKKFELTKQSEIIELSEYNQQREKNLREQYEHKEGLIIQQMQARMKTLIAQAETSQTEEIASLYSQNEELKKEIEGLKRMVQVKESLLVVLAGKEGSNQTVE